MNMDAKSSKPRYAAEDRIGVLEELLGERYSVRAFLPEPVPRKRRRAASSSRCC